MKKFVMLLVAVSMATLLFAGAGFAADYPSEPIEMIAPATPGGGWDTTARSIQHVIKKNDMSPESIIVTNKPGGGGAVGWTYLNSKAGSGYYLAVNSSLVFLNELLGRSELSYTDFTPIAIMATEWCAVFVGKDSKFDSGIEVMEALKEDPTSLSIAVAPSLGNDDHLSFVMAAKAYGVDTSKLRFVVMGSGGDILPALLGGHVDVVTGSVSEGAEHARAGKVKVLAVTSDERLGGELSDVPTWKEQGIDVVFPHWRGVMGPKDMPQEAIDWWNKTLSAVVETEDWAKILKNNKWDDFYKNSEETKAFMDENFQMYKNLVEELGLAQN
ncbi:MAG: tripartite tricarboxylate transporter substrate binding protein [Synergistales bacterium]|nr:tripartite tricarboxylate transporter substrate binding protein [Synergistales bacterium]